jgi:hypothetical protein
MKRIVLISLVLAAAAWPSGAGAGTLHGIVVGRLAARTLVAAPNGLVQAYRGRAPLGARVVIRYGKLAVVGRARLAHIRGVVIRSTATTTFLSSGGHLLALRTPVRKPASARRLSSATDSNPPPTATLAPATGQVVNATVSCDGGQLVEQQASVLGTATSMTVPVQATVAAVAPGSVTLTVNGQNLTLMLPAGLTLPASLVGQPVTLNIQLAPAQTTSSQNGDDDNQQGDSDDQPQVQNYQPCSCSSGGDSGAQQSSWSWSGGRHDHHGDGGGWH